MKIYSALYAHFYPFESFHDKCIPIVAETPEDLETGGKGYLVVWGGEDIHPSLYSRPDRGSHVGTYPSRRDLAEWSLMREAVRLGIPIIGVCRGAQMLCALAGGRLAQDVDGHVGNHTIIITSSGVEIDSSSLHHQMMYPWDDDGTQLGDILATSVRRSEHYTDLTGDEAARYANGEPEVVWFPRVKGLAIQGHPEFMNENCPFNNYTKELIHTYV